MVRNNIPIEYCLYRHIRPDKNEPFYIGIGTEKRSKDCKLRTKWWKNVYNVNDGNIEIDILEDGLSWKEAVEKEIWWIKLYGRADQGKGPLVNLTDGGEGACGREKTMETRQKFKDTMDTKGVHHMKGYKHTEEAKKKIAEAGKRKKYIEEIAKIVAGTKGREKSPEEVQRWKESRGINKRKIININTKEEFTWVAELPDTEKYTKDMVMNRLRGKVKDSTFPYKYKD